ncbi:MAG: redoxin domain-containing protein [Chitinophagaceae bacterium]|nr:redoxin domain-containing protein [Chitinophagaceae bacterium]
MRRRLYISLLGILLLSGLWSGLIAQKSLGVGDSVPGFNFKVFKASGSTYLSTADLKGKVMILDFWATWCAPCIPGLSKLDSIVQNLDNRVVVLAITQEPEDKLRKFLTKWKGRNVIFVSDTTHIPYFPYTTVPHSIVIDKYGYIAGVTTPEDISAEIVNDLLVGKPVEFLPPEKHSGVGWARKDSLILSGFERYLSPYDSNSTTDIKLYRSNGVTNLNFTNFTIPSLFREVFRMPAHSWVIDSACKDVDIYEPPYLFCLKVQLPEATDEMIFKEAQRILNLSLQFRGDLKEVTQDVYVLTKARSGNRTPVATSAQETDVTYYGPNFKGQRIRISHLVDYLSNEMGYLYNRIVLDETRLSGYYDIEMEWNYADHTTLVEELHKHGLELTRKKRAVNMLLISKK